MMMMVTSSRTGDAVVVGGELGWKPWLSTEVAVKLLGRQPVPGKVRCHQNPGACRCLSQVIQSLLRTRVTGARIAMAAQENRILTLLS